MLDEFIHEPRIARFGCCSLHEADKTIQQLISRGEAVTHGGHRVRLIAFGFSSEPLSHSGYSTLTLGHIVSFIEGYLVEHWKVFRHARFKHPALGLFMVLEKARRQTGSMGMK